MQKPQNIFIDGKGNPKIGDFDLSKKFIDKTKTIVPSSTFRIGGTPNYIAPEVLDFDNPVQTLKSDIYSFGILLYELLFPESTPKPTDQLLFQRKEEEYLVDIPPKNDKGLFQDNDPLYQHSINLFRSMLTIDPSKRSSASSLLIHPFFFLLSLFINSPL